MDFRRDILPKLQVRVIAEAIGASLSHGSKVRGAKLVSQKRHWKALIERAFSRQPEKTARPR